MSKILTGFGSDRNVSIKTDKVSTLIDRNKITQAWKDFKDLEGMRTSEMTEYQKRLVELFTIRVNVKATKKVPEHQARELSEYILQTIWYFELGKGLTTKTGEYRVNIIEDEEINFPIQPCDEYVHENAINSLHEEIYIPVRSRRGNTSRTIRGNRTGVKSPFTALNGSTKERFLTYELFMSHSDLIFMESGEATWRAPKSDIESLGLFTSDMLEREFNILYDRATFHGDYFEIDNKRVYINSPLLPTETRTLGAITGTIIGQLVYWSRTNKPAPSWAVSALTHYRLYGDEEFPDMLGELGSNNSNGDIPEIKQQRGLKSTTLMIATELYYKSYAGFKRKV